MNETIHPFEKAGLGKAPFRYVGMEEQEISYGQAVVGSIGGLPIYTKPGGTCAYCGQYILNMFNVESADGNRFHVGCDCIKKVDAQLGKMVDKDVKKMKKNREDDRIVWAHRNLERASALWNQPHPNTHLASQGKTLSDYVQYLLGHAGRSGQLRAARMVEKALAPINE